MTYEIPTPEESPKGRGVSKNTLLAITGAAVLAAAISVTALVVSNSSSGTANSDSSVSSSSDHTPTVENPEDVIRSVIPSMSGATNAAIDNVMIKACGLMRATSYGSFIQYNITNYGMTFAQAQTLADWSARTDCPDQEN